MCEGRSEYCARTLGALRIFPEPRSGKRKSTMELIYRIVLPIHSIDLNRIL